MDSTTKRQSDIPKCKDILLRKLSYAVICSVISQVFVLFMFLFIVNFDIFEPLNFLKLTFQTFTSVSTWIYIVPFSSIIFAQSLVCAKDYVLTTNCYSTRIQKVLSILSLRSLLHLTLYIIIGGMMVWLFLVLGGGQYENFTTTCNGNDKCVIEGTLFLLISGLWTGFYYFANVYVVEKKILFPIIYQNKIVHFKSKFISLINKSRRAATWPTLYFMTLYYICGTSITNSITDLLGMDSHVQIEGYAIYFYMWLFSVLYMVSMNLMRFFFELFLTEPIAFPITQISNDDLCLADAIQFSTIPVIQHLACLDLYMLSIWSKQRRVALFSLSQPGGHPHNWNYLINSALKLIKEYCECLNIATSTILNPEPILQRQVPISSITSPLASKFRNIRNMTIVDSNDYDIVNISQDRNNFFGLKLQNFNANAKEKVRNAINFLRKKLGIDYLFGELPESYIQRCLVNAQNIMWTTQGLSSLATASLKEDRFGIVQKDLPVIITSLVELKTCLEKLNRVPTLNRKSVFNDFNVKMKTAINGSVKRSLFCICNTFGQYLKDLPLSKEVLQQLQLYVSQKSV